MRFRHRNIQRKHCKAAAAEPYRKKNLRGRIEICRDLNALLPI